MNTESHKMIGNYLTGLYLQDFPPRYRQAFFLGCIAPDKNPFTYCKGSLQSQWLRGHNWCNAQKYIKHLCIRLESQTKQNLLSFYTLGKLIHYTADAFTFSHNLHFPQSLKAHRTYERQLADYLRCYMKDMRMNYKTTYGSVLESIMAYRFLYMRTASGVQADTEYALMACHSVMQNINSNKKQPDIASIFV